jgi:hypothetical protein
VAGRDLKVEGAVAGSMVAMLLPSAPALLGTLA